MGISSIHESVLIAKFAKKYQKHGPVLTHEKPFSSGASQGLYLRVRHGDSAGMLGHALILIQNLAEGRVVRVLSTSGRVRLFLRAAKRGEGVSLPYALCVPSQGVPPKEPLALFASRIYGWFEKPAFE